MQKLITKYGLAAHLAFLAVAPLFLSSTAILWVSGLVALWVLMEPSRIGNEMLHGARSRVWSALVHDPLFWLLSVLVLISGVRALNGGVALAYDAELGNWAIASPHWPILPGTVDGENARLHFSLFVALLVVVTGCRHALGRSARFACSLTAAGIAGAALLIRVVLAFGDFSSLTESAACASETPIYVGLAYAMLCLLSLTSLVAAFERRWWKALPLQCVGLVGTSLAVFLYSPGYLFALCCGCALLVLLYGFLYLRLKIGRLSDFKYLVVVGVSFVFAGMLAMVVLSPEQLEAKLSVLISHEFFTRSFFAAREALSRISLSIWKDNPWIGTGLGSFALDLNFHAVEADWRVISPLQIAPLNGYWLLLVERGVVGAFLIVAPIVLLLISYIYRLTISVRALPHPLAVLAPLVLIMNLATMLVDCSALAPAAFILTFAVIQLSANSFAKKEDGNG